ncbi:MAG: Chromosome segregation and condensation protein B [Candidatus Methanohalarchaeum thermophilum]|uniref:Chromosome segregation and condensation protein B n=1 Tax=Methanohalarchaeum thermophilum TaxID=1903181 RepID=A0A1Q6DXD2_METT1|nr:MAG: Chromosome segregation and condensation protein B [Candidatus Methanohalarchaeum thermophilum]
MKSKLNQDKENEEEIEEKLIVESALFTAGEPLSINEITEYTSLNEETILDSIKKLNKEYNQRETSIEIKDAGNKYVMQISPKYAKYVRQLAPRDISTPILRTLSVIAFRQPIRQSKVVDIRGNKAYEHIKKLEEMKLTNSEPQGRTKLLYTTKEFSEYFGLDVTDPAEVRRTLLENYDTETLEDFLNE